MTAVRRVILFIALLMLIVAGAMILLSFVAPSENPWITTGPQPPWWRRTFFESVREWGLVLSGFAIVFGVLGFAIFRSPRNKID